MRDWPRIVGLVLMIPVTVYGALRASEMMSAVQEMAPPVTEAGGAPHVLEGESIFNAARILDALAMDFDPGAARSPFRAPVEGAPPQAAPRARTPRADFPQVVMVLSVDGRVKVVLEVGGERSGPIAAGSVFRGWTLLQAGWDVVLLERAGVIYTLPAR